MQHSLLSVNLSLCVLPSHVFVPFTGVVIWTNLEKWGEEGGSEVVVELPQVFQFWAMLFAAACRENDTSQTVVKVTRMDLRAKIIVFAVSGAETLLLVGAAAKLCSSAHCVCERQCRTQMRGSRLQATKWHFPCFSLNSRRLWCSHNHEKKKGAVHFLGLKNTFWLPVDLWEVASFPLEKRLFKRQTDDHKRTTL